MAKHNILVAEEKAPLLHVTSSFLTSLGYDVAAVESGPAMRDKLNGGEVDLIILDLFFYSKFQEDIQQGLDRLQGKVPMIVLTNMGYDAKVLNNLLKSDESLSFYETPPHKMSMSKTLPIQHLAENVSKCLPEHPCNDRSNVTVRQEAIP